MFICQRLIPLKARVKGRNICSIVAHSKEEKGIRLSDLPDINNGIIEFAKEAEVENRVAEVIDAGTTEFTAECYEIYIIPELGSLVKINNPPLEIYGVVCQAGTSSIEPGRLPIARGKDQTSQESVYQASPQLLKLLRSTFRALVVGFRQGNKLYQYLPPRPPPIHAFVHNCVPDEIAQFSQSTDFLNLLNNPKMPIANEELVATTLRVMSRYHIDPQTFLVKAGKKLALLYGGDYQRLKMILGRLQL